MEAESRLSDSFRENLKAGRGILPRLEGIRVGEEFHENSNGPLFFPSLVYFFFFLWFLRAKLIDLDLYQNLNQP